MCACCTYESGLSGARRLYSCKILEDREDSINLNHQLIPGSVSPCPVKELAFHAKYK